MLDNLDDLYREVIIEHSQNSRHKGELPDAQIKVEGNNPLCGDELFFHVQLKDGKVEKARFSGQGCAISQATASMLSAEMEGKGIDAVYALIALLRGMMQGKDPETSMDIGDLEALAGVRRFPIRVKCAALSWNVIEQGLKDFHGGVPKSID